MKVLLAKNFDPEKNDPTNWWISEKLDGIRAVWTGQKFVTRNGNRIYTPEWFTRDLPNRLPLDGELWAGRGNFQDATSIVRSQSEDKGWDRIAYMVFDVPSEDAGPFEQRQVMLACVLPDVRHVRLVKQRRCTGRKDLSDTMDRLVKVGGEGLMLRQPGSYYEHKRSSTLLKVKRFLDAEATVIGHVGGLGKHRGRLGALVCRLRNGIEFEVGTGFTDAERERPPRVGSKITFSYQELSRDGRPRFPVYMRPYERS